jgi:hypothetical protein
LLNGQLPVLSQFYVLSVAQSNDNDYEQSFDATLKGLLGACGGAVI